MLKKSLKLSSALIFAMIIFVFHHYSCTDEKTSNGDNSTPIILNNTIIKNDTITFSTLKSNSKNTLYSRCIFNYKITDYCDVQLSSVEFDSCQFGNMDFLNCRFSDVLFYNCYFQENRISNAKLIKNLIFYNTHLDTIILDQSSFNSLKIFTAQNEIIKYVLIRNCNSSNGILFSGNFKEIIFEGGQVKNLDITNITNSDCKFSVVSTNIEHSNLFSNETEQPSVFFNAALENAQFTPNDKSMLSEELNVDDLSTKESYYTLRTSINKKYIALRTAYNHLSKIFGDQKKYDLSDYFDYRSKVCDRKITSTRVGGFFSCIFHEKMRGNYGTSSIIVLKTMLIIFLLFTSIYFFLGVFNYSFGFYVNTNFSGEILPDEKPILITLRHDISTILNYTRHCFLFSLNQMILGGISRDFHISDFSIWYLYPPRKYGLIGIGRFFSLIQNIIGLMMLFFLITAFLRLNR